MLKNFLFLILKSVRYRPIRSWLTIIGIIIGIMLVIIILSLSSGIQNAVLKTLQNFGSDLIFVYPGKETLPFAGIAGGQKFRENDLIDLNGINGIKFVMPMNIASLNVEFYGEKKSVLFHSQPWREMKIISEESKGLKLIDGSWPTNDDNYEIMLGYRAAFKLFKNNPKINGNIIVKGKRFKVAGIFSEVGIQDEDNQMYMSLKKMQELISLPRVASSAIIKIENGSNSDLIVRQINYQLSKQEVVKDFSILSQEKAGRLVGNVLSIIEFALMIIAFISLLVGAVGIMNTMYTSVLERTKQIGIMKAIGAPSESIMTLFLIESGLIGLIGGIIGTIFGIFFSYLIGAIAALFGIKELFSFILLDYFGFLSILIITFITGIVAGVLPARQAAKMEPAEALRYE